MEEKLREPFVIRAAAAGVDMHNKRVFGLENEWGKNNSQARPKNHWPKRFSTCAIKCTRSWPALDRASIKIYEYSLVIKTIVTTTGRGGAFKWLFTLNEQ